MFKPTADKKGIIELSLKQRDQWLNYQFDKARSTWPELVTATEVKPIKHSRDKNVTLRRTGSQ